MSLTAPDSLLVYTYRNILYHFVINASTNAVSLKQVGQIALNGIVRAPARVRAVSWILPEHQLRKSMSSTLAIQLTNGQVMVIHLKMLRVHPYYF